MSEYDHACKAAARSVDADGLLRWILPAWISRSYSFERWLPTETLAMPGEPDRHCDTVAGFNHHAGTQPPLAFVVEFQTTPRPRTLARLGEYCFRVYREIPVQREPFVPYQVLCKIVYLTGPAQADEFVMRAEPESTNPSDPELGLRLRVDGLTLSEVEATTVVEAVATGEVSRAALSFVPLMRGADSPGLVARWREVAETLNDDRNQATIGFLALTFAKLVTWREIWRRELEGWKVEKSPYWEEIRAGGRIEGRSEGRLEQARETLIDQIPERFGTAVAVELTPHVRQMDDLAVLNRCLKLIVPGDLEQLRALLTATQSPA